jgi:UDP-glucose 4-epimerase
VNDVSLRSRFYVTGASGFLGRRVCSRLAEHGTVRALMRSPGDGPWDAVDVVDLSKDPPPPGALSGVDTVIHLAARTHAVDESGDTEGLYRAINVDGTRRLLEAAKRAGVRRFVFVSSVKAMGEGGGGIQDETATPIPATWYGKTKRAAETMAMEGTWTPETVVLRPALMYGPGVSGNVERMIEAVRAGRFPPVPEVGNSRSMVHGDDAADAVVLAATAGRAAGRLFIVTDGRPCSTREMYEWICEALGQTPRRRTPPLSVYRGLAKAGDLLGRLRGRRWMFDSQAFGKLFGSAAYDSSAICRELGFEPKWTFRTALPEIVSSDAGRKD